MSEFTFLFRGRDTSASPEQMQKDVVGGYMVIEAKDLAHAAELSKGCPILEVEGSVEVRPIQRSVLPRSWRSIARLRWRKTKVPSGGSKRSTRLATAIVSMLIRSTRPRSVSLSSAWKARNRARALPRSACPGAQPHGTAFPQQKNFRRGVDFDPCRSTYS